MGLVVEGFLRSRPRLVRRTKAFLQIRRMVAARQCGSDREQPARYRLRRLPARRGCRAKVALCRDPASDRPAARIACAGDMMGGKQVMAAVEGRAMRRSPAEPAATGCRRPWGRFRSIPTLKIASRRVLLTDLCRRSIVDARDRSHRGNLG